MLQRMLQHVLEHMLQHALQPLTLPRACAYADDLLCLAPNRTVLQRMVTVCEEYGSTHNMVFSTDPVPAKSKTKCMLICGKNKVAKYPDPVILDGQCLLWV